MTNYHDRMARVYSYDISWVLAALKPAPPIVTHRYMRYDTLVDDWLNHAFHSYQFLGMNHYLPEDIHTYAREWISEQDEASSRLWHIFSIENQYAGREAFLVRRNHMLWVFVLL